MNNVSDVLTNNTKILYNVLNTAYAGGADPTGTNDSAGAIQAAVTAAINNGGGIVYLPKGTYKVASTITALLSTVNQQLTVKIVGDGMRATFINSAVTGDCIRMYTTGSIWQLESGIQHLTIDGTSAGNSSTGLHVGDFENLVINQVQVQNFSGTSSIGIYFHNTQAWTEEADVRATIRNCTTGVKYASTSPGTNSFGYGVWDFTMYQTGGTTTGGQDGITIDGSGPGALLYHGSLRMRGNFTGSTSALTNTPLRMINGGEFAGVHLQIQIESAHNTNNPNTMIVDGTSGMIGCYGILDYSFGGSPGLANASLAGGSEVQFTGLISGDTSLASTGVYGGYGFAMRVGSLDIVNPGNGLMVAEGSNAKQGTFTLTANGRGTVSTTAVTASSRIFLTNQSSGGSVGTCFIASKSAGSSFVVQSTSTTDTSTYAYEIFEPG